jgi:membrane associated rhomboid family serine protease
MPSAVGAFPPPFVAPRNRTVEMPPAGPTMLFAGLACNAVVPTPLMDFRTPHATHTSSPRAKESFRLALRVTLAFVGLLWGFQIVDTLLGLDASPFGVRPRSVEGLVGILFAPLVHAGFEHLLQNTLPLVILGTTMLHLYPQASRIVLPAVWLGPGLAVWLFARGGVHLGASGLVYGLIAYVFASGMIRRDRRALAAALAVAMLYGAAVWGVLPIQRAVSWETHLAAAILGVVLALALRNRDPVPVVRYEWEGRDDVIDLDPTGEEPGAARMPGAGPTLH